jgi:hypothetical protein
LVPRPRIRILYVHATGAKRIYHQTFSVRKLGLDMDVAKRLAKAPSRSTHPSPGGPYENEEGSVALQAQEARPRKPFLRNLPHVHYYRHFGFALLLVCRSQNGVSNTVGGPTGQNSLDKFEQLIRDAIALLIERGEISILRKKPLSSQQTSKRKDSDPPDSSTGIT